MNLVPLKYLRALKNFPEPDEDVVIETDDRWLMRTMRDGKWVSDIGEFKGAEEVRSYARRQKPEPGVMRFPIRVRTLEVTQAF